jgi:hypothetical protein
MRSRWFPRFNPRFFALIGVIAVALSVTAAASADTTKKHFTFDHEVVIAGTKLSAGDYTLVIQDGHLTVKLENKIVAQAATRWDDTPDGDSVLYGDNNQVIEIRFAHERAVLILVATP